MKLPGAAGITLGEQSAERDPGRAAVSRESDLSRSLGQRDTSASIGNRFPYEVSTCANANQ